MVTETVRYDPLMNRKSAGSSAMLVKCQPPPGQNNSDSNASVCATLSSTHVIVLEFICELAVAEFLGVVNHVTHSAPHVRSCTSQASGLSTVSVPADETQ